MKRRRLLPTLCLVAGSTSAVQACEATLANHDALTSDMSLAHVTSVSGCDGIQMSSRVADGVRIDSYIWDGNGDPGSNMILLFADDRLLNRTQIGLQ